MAKKVSKFILSSDGSLPQSQRWGQIQNPKAGEKVVDSFEFTDTLYFVKASKTSYSQKLSIMFKNSSGATFPMFLKDLSDAIPHMEKGILKGDFVTVKRGSKGGVRLIV